MLSSTFLTLHVLFALFSSVVFAQNVQQELVTMRERRVDTIMGSLEGYGEIANW